MILSWLIQRFLVASGEDGGFLVMLREKTRGCGGKTAKGEVSVNISEGNFDSGYQEPLNFKILLLELNPREVTRCIQSFINQNINYDNFILKRNYLSVP